MTQEATWPEAYTEPRWYAAYTCAQHEKRVAQLLEQRSVLCYLPLYESLRRWKDRRVLLELPLFPGYVFVNLALRERLRVLELPGVVRLVGFNGRPTPLDDGQVEILREGLSLPLHAEPHPYLRVGRRVRIRSGPLRGLEGILVRRRGDDRIVVSMDLIRRAIAVDVDLADVVPVSRSVTSSSGRVRGCDLAAER